MHCFTKSYKILLKLLPKIKILLHYKVYLDISCPDTNRQNVDHRKVFLKKPMNSPMPPVFTKVHLELVNLTPTIALLSQISYNPGIYSSQAASRL